MENTAELALLDRFPQKSRRQSWLRSQQTCGWPRRPWGSHARGSSGPKTRSSRCNDCHPRRRDRPPSLASQTVDRPPPTERPAQGSPPLPEEAVQRDVGVGGSDQVSAAFTFSIESAAACRPVSGGGFVVL